MRKSAECVTPKHPDKMCDQISDAILDLCLLQDPSARVAVEVLGGHGHIRIIGEVSFAGETSEKDILEAVKRITGQEQEDIEINIVKQSSQIANGVDTGGAGDQGIMVGYACNDNEAMIPQELYLARNLCKFLYEKFPYDGKTQVTIDENKAITAIVASFQNVSEEILRENIDNWFSISKPPFFYDTKIYANPAGDWNIGGFDVDTGLTGRKLMVDNYGPQVAIGGGCFSGKDATKVDRSGAYMARKLAVQLLRQRNAKEVTVKLAYAIGIAQPVMVSAVIDGVETILPDNENLTPASIIKLLDLKKPQFEETAKWGHFGNNFFWDK